MSAKVCPTCHKPNCGNWAACARRVAPQHNRVASPLPPPLHDLETIMVLGHEIEKIRRAHRWDFWIIVGKVDYMLRLALGDHVDVLATNPARLGQARWEAANMLEADLRASATKSRGAR